VYVVTISGGQIGKYESFVREDPNTTQYTDGPFEGPGIISVITCTCKDSIDVRMYHAGNPGHRTALDVHV
jgi:hypothetical protein